jgi:hypothetical protein
LIEKRCGRIDCRHRDGNRPTKIAALQQTTKEQTMVASMMKTFDRYALTFFLALAVTPVLALAAAGTIH